jgi:hypothetical protein
MQRLLMLSLSALVTIYSANAIADSSLLKGTYGATWTNACLYASGGFNASFQALGTTFSSQFASEGIYTFNGDGTGTFAFRSTSITPPPTVGFLPEAGSSESTGTFTYTVMDTGGRVGTRTFPTFTQQAGTDVGTVLTGSRAGQTFKLEGVPMRVGIISADGRTLTTSFTAPGTETLTYSNGDVRLRICTLSTVLIKLDLD